jgi:hypothetical protein
MRALVARAQKHTMSIACMTPLEQKFVQRPAAFHSVAATANDPEIVEVVRAVARQRLLVVEFGVSEVSTANRTQRVDGTDTFKLLEYSFSGFPTGHCAVLNLMITMMQITDVVKHKICCTLKFLCKSSDHNKDVLKTKEIFV